MHVVAEFDMAGQHGIHIDSNTVAKATAYGKKTRVPGHHDIVSHRVEPKVNQLSARVIGQFDLLSRIL